MRSSGRKGPLWVKTQSRTSYLMKNHTSDHPTHQTEKNFSSMQHNLCCGCSPSTVGHIQGPPPASPGEGQLSPHSQATAQCDRLRGGLGWASAFCSRPCSLPLHPSVRQSTPSGPAPPQVWFMLRSPVTPANGVQVGEGADQELASSGRWKAMCKPTGMGLGRPCRALDHPEGCPYKLALRGMLPEPHFSRPPASAARVIRGSQRPLQAEEHTEQPSAEPGRAV